MIDDRLIRKDVLYHIILYVLYLMSGQFTFCNRRTRNRLLLLAYAQFVTRYSGMIISCQPDAVEAGEVLNAFKSEILNISN